MPVLVVAVIIVIVLYIIGFSWLAAIGIVLFLAALIVLVAWLADKDVIRLWHLGVLVLVCFVGNRSCAYIVSERQLHQPLSVMPGVQVKPILGPANFPSISDLDDSQFDVAPDGSIIFRSGDQLFACTMSNDSNSIAVVAEEAGLNAFIFDAGGTLLTMNQGVLGQFNPSQPAATTWHNSAPQIDLTQGSHVALAQFAPSRGRSGVGPVRGGGGGYRGGGGGDFFSDGPRITIGDTFRWFFKPPNDVVTEKVGGGPPPPLSDGAYNYTLVVHDPPRLPKYPQPLQLLPGPDMRLARGEAAGQVLVFGSHNTRMARELHRIYSDGTAQWVVNTASPIVFAGEGHGHLYIVIAPASHTDEAQSLQDWNIVHLPLGTNELNSPALVFKSMGGLPGDRRILSFALSESGKTIFFSVPNRVYAIRGPLVVKVLDGISGILRTHGDTLYVFNAKRKALLAVTGFE